MAPSSCRARSGHTPVNRVDPRAKPSEGDCAHFGGHSYRRVIPRLVHEDCSGVGGGPCQYDKQSGYYSGVASQCDKRRAHVWIFLKTCGLSLHPVILSSRIGLPLRWDKGGPDERGDMQLRNCLSTKNFHALMTPS